MRLTDYTDYSLRVLMFCALNSERSVTIAELAQSHGISKNHLMKVVHGLAKQGWLQTTRGRGGGLTLLKPPGEIVIGEVVRATETDFRMVECFDPQHNACTLTEHCQLKHVLASALASYLAVLDRVTLADITTPGGQSLAAGLVAHPVSLSALRGPAGR
jgi:Rrf2 family transcriptional regulator, nitric oxide-sensitive transcriptional repressor